MGLLGAMEYGIVSLLPTALVLALAIKTRRTLESVIAGAIFAFLIMDGVGFVDDPRRCLPVRSSDEDIAWIILVCALYGVFIALLVRSGGSMAFGRLLLARLQNKRQSLLTTWVLGLVIFLDDYLNSDRWCNHESGNRPFQRLLAQCLPTLLIHCCASLFVSTHIQLGAYFAGLLEKNAVAARWERVDSLY